MENYRENLLKSLPYHTSHQYFPIAKALLHLLLAKRNKEYVQYSGWPVLRWSECMLCNNQPYLCFFHIVSAFVRLLWLTNEEIKQIKMKEKLTHVKISASCKPATQAHVYVWLASFVNVNMCKHSLSASYVITS